MLHIVDCRPTSLASALSSASGCSQLLLPCGWLFWARISLSLSHPQHWRGILINSVCELVLGFFLEKAFRPGERKDLKTSPACLCLEWSIQDSVHGLHHEMNSLVFGGPASNFCFSGAGGWLISFIAAILAMCQLSEKETFQVYWSHINIFTTKLNFFPDFRWCCVQCKNSVKVIWLILIQELQLCQRQTTRECGGPQISARFCFRHKSTWSSTCLHKRTWKYAFTTTSMYSFLSWKNVKDVNLFCSTARSADAAFKVSEKQKQVLPRLLCETFFRGLCCLLFSLSWEITMQKIPRTLDSTKV